MKAETEKCGFDTFSLQRVLGASRLVHAMKVVVVSNSHFGGIFFLKDFDTELNLAISDHQNLPKISHVIHLEPSGFGHEDL